MIEVEFNIELIIDKYKLFGEIWFIIVYDILEVINFNVIEIYDQKIIEIVWKFLVDIDGNGVYDSFDVYGIFLWSLKLS